MVALQHRSAALPTEAQSVAGPGPAPLTLVVSERFDGWPLLVLDTGAFLTRCRWCDWKSPRQSTPGGAWAAFDAHVCEERSA